MQQVTPKNYKIHLIPDLTRFTFSGSVTLLAEAETAIEVLHLNMLDLTITSCALRADDHFIECAFDTDNEKEELQIRFPQKFKVASRFRCYIRDRSTTKWPAFIEAGMQATDKQNILPLPNSRKVMPEELFRVWITR